VGREGEIVNPTLFHLDLAVGDQLRRIYQQMHPIAASDSTDRCQIVEHAQDIGCAAHSHERNSLLAVSTILVVIAQERFQFVQIHKTFGVHRESQQRDAGNRAPW